MNKGLKNLVFYAISILISLVFFLFLIGIVEWGFSYSSFKFSDIIEEHDVLNHRLVPNAVWKNNNIKIIDPRYEAHQVEHNAQGWVEDYDVEFKKPANTYRVFYVGDSFTLGSLVPRGQSVPDIVENYLYRNFKDKKYEVINAGTSGYSTIIYNVLIRQFIQNYEPDLIVLNIDMTDNREDKKYKSSTVFDENGIPTAVLPRRLFKEKYLDTEKGMVENSLQNYIGIWLSKHSYTYNYFSFKRGVEQKQKEDYPPNWKDWTQHEWDADIQEDVDFTLGQLKQIIEFCKSKNIKLIVTSVPHYGQFVYENEKPKWSLRPHEAIEKLTEEMEVPYFNSHKFLLRYFKNTPQTKYFFRRDMHFNEKGFSLWANAHKDALEDFLINIKKDK